MRDLSRRGSSRRPSRRFVLTGLPLVTSLPVVLTGLLLLIGLPVVLTGLLLLIGLPGFAAADEWRDGAPAMATSGTPEDHVAESEYPSKLEAKSHEMVQGHTEDPDGMVVGSEQEDVVDSGRLENHRGSSDALRNLQVEKPDQGLEVIDDGRLARVVGDELTAQQRVAKNHLERAQAAAERARTRYGDMMRSNYPRGEARIRIVQERDESMRALERSRSEFDAAMGS